MHQRGQQTGSRHLSAERKERTESEELYVGGDDRLQSLLTRERGRDNRPSAVTLEAPEVHLQRHA